MLIFTRRITQLFYLAVLLGGLLRPAAAMAQARWSRQAGGLSGMATSVALDASNNAYVVGTFRGTAKFGDISLTSVGSVSGFVAKYSPQGTVLWARQTGGAVDFTKVAVDVSGNAYVLGGLTGSTSLDGQTLNSQGAFDLILIKYDPQGQVLWSRQGGSQPGGSLSGLGLAFDAQGNAYVAGTLTGTASWAGGTLTSESSQGNLFLASYSAQGTVRWVQQGGGKTSRSSGGGLCLDAAGNVYVAGSFSGTAVFGSTTLTNTTGLLLAKCDATGKFGWAIVHGGGGSVYYSQLAVDALGNSVLTGTTNGGTFGPYTLTSAGGQDGFVVKHDAAGQVLWLRQVAGSMVLA